MGTDAGFPMVELADATAAVEAEIRRVAKTGTLSYIPMFQEGIALVKDGGLLAADELHSMQI